ncbi:hypothetical protein [Anabaena lutea]|uniref:7-cyano-7-deazaguanine synthase n=1 Tax=Anabaena lutea FACHB-196 TaxID=2692881 RepID=A0ABR8FC01_9NOST|nr:hypothetical protein [Anabaena lutea]MBD2567390.1 hypothetical protein [Anabaena lutea FACHB-196]
MKISNFRSEQEGNLFKVAATIVWEDRDRSPQDIYIATTQEFAKDLSCNPHSFLVACIMVAFYYGEKRIYIDAEICPQLIENLNTATALVKHWYKSDRSRLKIEAKIKTSIETPTTDDRAAIFFTGGIDTLATLRLNRTNYPLTHPGSIKDGLFIYGFADTTLENFEKAYNSFDEITKDAGITLIPVYTNIYSHIKDLEYESIGFWRDYQTGAALSAIAHAFNKRITSASISSSDEIQYLAPWGTHPLLDPNYSSYDLKIRHEYINFSRFSKTKIVSEWDVALQNLRVCDELNLTAGYLNCGKCAKCVVTMTQLLSLGLLKKTNVFPVNDISAELIIKKANIKHWDEEAYYLKLVDLLQDQNRDDLIQAIKKISVQFRLKQGIKKVDHKIFNNALYNYYENTIKKILLKQSNI